MGVKFIVTIHVFESGHMPDRNYLLHTEEQIVVVPQDVIDSGVDAETYALEWLGFVVNENWSGDFVGEVREYTETDWLLTNKAPMLFDV